MAKAVSTRKAPVRKKTSSVVEAATGAIKMPISFKEFAKKPTAAIAFLAVTGIAYVYVDLKKIFENNSVQQNVRIDKLVESANKNVSKNGEVQQKAAQKANEIVDKAADKITTLKSEVSQLKTQLNETKAKLDSANSIDDSKPFSIKGAGG